jgi:lipopolysaccharide export system protein LptA
MLGLESFVTKILPPNSRKRVMAKRFVIPATVVLLSATTAFASEPVERSAVLAPSPAITVETKMIGSSAELHTVSTKTKIELSASKITYDGETQETTLEGSARVLFDGREVRGDVILLRRVQNEKGAIIAIAALLK